MDKTIVKNSVSGTEKDNLENPSGKGQSPLDKEKEIENRVRENLRAEYDRKQEVLQEKFEDATSRLNELEEKDRLTRTEKAEKVKLESKVEGLEDGLYQLDNDPQYAVMSEKFKRTKRESIEAAVNTATKESSFNSSKQLASLYLELRAEKEETTTEKLESEIESICKADWDYFKRLLPYERAKKAYAIRSKESAYTKKLRDLEKDKKSDKFIEDSNTVPKADMSTGDLIKGGNIDEALTRI